MSQLPNLRTKYNESFQYLQQRKKRQANQLKLLSNLRRGEQNISSNLMLTLFDRLMSNTYDDKMQVKFLPSQGITQNQINSYNILAQSDFQEMDMPRKDYDFTWDTLFFGYGFMETIRFNKKKKILEPCVINPLVFFYDPYVEEVQDWRYYAKWITKSKSDLKLLQKAGVIDSGVKLDLLQSGIDPYIWQYKIIYDEAREGVPLSIQPTDSDVFQLLEMYYTEEDGTKKVVWVDKNFSVKLYERELDLEDGDPILSPLGDEVKRNSNWPIVRQESFRIPHTSLPISVADLLDDKQRAKSVLLNLAYVAAKDTANPIYLYDPDKVRDVTQFLSRQISQHIPVEGDPLSAVQPMNKTSPMTADQMAFINMLTQEANEPIGTGEALQPVTTTKETATEISIDQQLNDLAQSLQSKVLQFGKKEFWSQWFHRYAKYSKELESKMANIVGVKGVDTQLINLKDFQTDYPPGVMVYSAKEAEYKNLVNRRDYMQLYPALAQTLPPEGMRNFQKHVFFPLFLEDPSLIDVMFPDTIDEMQAKTENQQLEEDILAKVEETDDHSSHIYIHSMSQPKTWATWLHLDWHKKLLAEQKKQQLLTMQATAGGTMNPSTPQQPVAKPQVSAERQSPQGNAAPLKTEIQANIQK